jgi:hypothetical protein
MEITLSDGETPVTFSRPGKSYIFADYNGQPGSLGLQICENGSFRGYTLTYSGDDLKEFKRICQKWLRRASRQSTHTSFLP